ncbi:MAG: glycine hydroxymethyltransferase, partial [Simkania negevensis]|nr:glycine hydroxymethyltransferase [Simkania negevensis]
VSAKMMKAVAYEVDSKTERIDYKALEKQVQEERPAIIVGGYSSYPRLINFAVMREIADSVGATLMVDMAHFAGLVAGKAITGEFDPVPYAHVVTSTTHKTLRGPRGGLILCKKEFGEVIDKGCPLVLGGPLPHVMAAKAVAFKEAKGESFKVYAKNVIRNAKAMAEKFLQLGVTLFTGGTDNHLLVLDVSKSFGLTGRQAENLLREAKITANRNSVPFDQHGAWFTSGIRLGTPALTTLGMGEKEMEKIAELIVFLLKGAKPRIEEGKMNRSKADVAPLIIERVGREVEELLKKYPLYPELKLMHETCSPLC